MTNTASSQGLKLDSLPETGTTETLIDEASKRIAFIKVDYDSDTESPNAWGGPKLLSFHRHHIDRISPEDLKNEEEYPPNRIVPVSYFEHGNCVWSVSGEGPQCPWDSVSYAGVILFPEDWEGDMQEAARSYCETYTAWSNGEVYGFRTSVYELKKDEDGDIIEDQHHYDKKTEIGGDSCWGFYLEDREAEKNFLNEINASLT